VTNLDNQLSVIVRVNDRGPFHGDRLIDLSYAAAARLGYHKKGLARVRIEAITPARGQTYTPSKAAEKMDEVTPEALPAKASMALPGGASSATSELVFSHLQLGAFSAEDSADRLKLRLFEAFDTSVNVLVNKQEDGLYKVLVGPFSNAAELDEWQKKLQQEGFGDPVRVALIL
jgi:rare lipoprotein A